MNRIEKLLREEVFLRKLSFLAQNYSKFDMIDHARGVVDTNCVK
jgi:hypothetical protein